MTKIVGKKKFDLKKTLKKILVEKNFGCEKKLLDGKHFGSKGNLSSKYFLGPIKFID